MIKSPAELLTGTFGFRGAIVKQIISYEIFNNKEDIDLFIYDLTIEEANLLRIEIIEFLVNKWIGNNVKINVQRNEFTTTIYVYNPIVDHYDRSYKPCDTYVYQLIHRIYPTIDSIIGGFDISACMVAYDGTQLYTTPLV